MDDMILMQLSITEGSRTWMIAARCDVSTQKMYRRLIKLEKAGRVKRSERYSACNDIFWVIA